MDTITREYSCLALVTEAIDDMVGDHGCVGWSVFDDHESVSPLVLYFSWHVMNPQGSYIGYEHWKLTIDLEQKFGVERNEMQEQVSDLAKHMVFWESNNWECINAPETEECSCGDPEDCGCERYFSPKDDPDNDVQWQIIAEPFLEELRKAPFAWVFGNDLKINCWSIVKGE